MISLETEQGYCALLRVSSCICASNNLLTVGINSFIHSCSVVVMYGINRLEINAFTLKDLFTRKLHPD